MNARTVLIKVDSVMFVTGESADAIYERATGSSLFDGYKWVWNVATDPNGEIRDLRFWSKEILAPSEATSRMSLDQVIKAILPASRSQYHSGEICNVLISIRRPSLKELRAELNGKLAANSSFFPREGLEKFLRRRWLGNSEAAQRRAA